jgi:hypothetical protein|tara:strand:- start:2 stop:412 length:411 start_codon:yes stop_codon:yes gene_type:complete
LRSPIFYVSPTHLRKLRVEYKIEGEEYRNRDNAYQRYSDPKHPLFGLPKQDALERWDILFEQIQNGYDDRYPLVLNYLANRLRLFDGHHRLSIVIELKYTHVPIQFREKAFGNLNMLFDSKESKIIMKRHTDYVDA